MTSPQPNQFEPSREQVQEIMRQVMLMSCAGFAKWHLTELHRETQAVKDNAKEIIKLHNSTLEEVIVALNKQLATANESIAAWKSSHEIWEQDYKLVMDALEIDFVNGTEDSSADRAVEAINTLLERVKGLEKLVVQSTQVVNAAAMLHSDTHNIACGGPIETSRALVKAELDEWDRQHKALTEAKG